LIRIRGARNRRAVRNRGRRHAPHRLTGGAAAGLLGDIRAAVRLHPAGFGLPAAVIAAGIAYLIVASPVSIRLGHPAPAAGHPQVAAQAPSSADPAQTARPGTGHAGQVGPPGIATPGDAYAPTGRGPKAAGRGGGQASPNPAGTTPGAASGSAPPAGPGPSPAPAPGSHATCLDLDLVTVCL
jgi:hypothetical protein